VTAASSRIVVGGRVECRTERGSLLVVVARAGCLQRNVVCRPVDFADVGDEVAVEVGADDLGTILEPRSRR